MTPDANNPVFEDDDLNTTAPNPPHEEWQMPEPVFRKTSGKLPQGFEKEFGNKRSDPDDLGPQVSTGDVLQTAAGETSAADVPGAEPKPKSSTVKLVLVLLGLAAMIGFLIVFLTVVYIFLLR